LNVSIQISLGKFLCNQNGYPYCQFVKSGSVPPRACLKIGDVPGDEEFGAAGKQFFRRNPDGFQGKIAPSSGQKARRLGMLTFFKQALGYKNPSIATVSLQ